MRWLFLGALAVIIALGVYLLVGTKPKQEGIVLYGNVDVRLVDIGFRIAGKVNDLKVEEGDFVKKGDLLCTIDQSPYDAQKAEAAANVKVVQATLKNSEILLKRRAALIGVGGVSQEDVDNAKATFDQQVATLAQAKAALAVQNDNILYTKVYAPTDGIILSRIKEPGSVVLASEPVYTLSVASPVWIRAYASERELGKIAFGQKALIYTDGGDVYEGHVGFISPMAEFTPKTVQTTELRTDLVYRLRIYADNPDFRLKQGMPVTVRLR